LGTTDRGENDNATAKRDPGSELGIAKRVLYFSPCRQHLDHLLASWESTPGCRVDRDAISLACKKVYVRFVPVHDYHEALRCLREDYFNLVMVDIRDLGLASCCVAGYAQQADKLLEAMASEKDVETRFGFHRVLVAVAGEDNDQVDDLLVHFGHWGVGSVIRDVSMCPLSAACPREPRSLHFSERVADEMVRMMLQRKQGKRALCASGGGITGIYFEMGALKCLDDCLRPDAVNSFDMYFGISAGAVVTGFLANGYTVDECMAAIAGYEGGRMSPVNLSLFKLKHANLEGYRDRLRRTARGVGGAVLGFLRGLSTFSVESLVMEYSDFVAPPFRGEAFEQTLRGFFSTPHATNDFRKLPRPLFIGATDQDTRSHVLFGDEGWQDVPISQAIQASLSINPAFRSAEIRGRFYEDGAVTRTSNFMEAIRRGSDLVFVIDPFLPYVSKEPGFARQRGILYNVDQNIRAISYTRFENARNAVLRHHPNVSSYTFLPANRLRRLMSVNPMDHRPYLPIWRGAYLSTLQRIQLLRYRMAGDLAVHGIRLDTERAEQVAERLNRTSNPSFADFFPDGRVALREPFSPRLASPQRALPPIDEGIMPVGVGPAVA
jgi:predicted acylesterase/phospholipase RssA